LHHNVTMLITHLRRQRLITDYIHNLDKLELLLTYYCIRHPEARTIELYSTGIQTGITCVCYSIEYIKVVTIHVLETTL